MRKLFWIFAAIAASQLTFASFELALVSDLGAREIDRYDPETGTYLGSFGGGILNSPTDIKINQSAGLAFVADAATSRTYVFNYNTGSYIRSFATGATYFLAALSNGDTLVSNFGLSDTRRYNSAGNLVDTISTSALYIEGMAQSATGQLWFMNAQGVRSLARGTVGSTSVTNAYTISGASTTPAYLTCTGSQLAAIDYNYATTHRIFSFETSGNSVASESSVVVTTATSTFGVGTSIGHGGLVYSVLSQATGATTLARWVPGTNYTTTYSLSQTSGAAGMALVVAPEPASISALGFGVTILLRRRRK